MNHAGGEAFAKTAKQSLAQYAATGCFGSTFYATADEQLNEVAKLVASVDSKFIAQCAVYARKQGHMKDMPAYLLAALASRAKGESRVPVETRAGNVIYTSSRPGNAALYFARTFPIVIDNAKMMSTFAQILRSGVTGRKSFGSMVKRVMQNWLASQSPGALFRGSVGHTPSIADIIKMVHPHPGTPGQAFNDARRASYAYLIGKPYEPGMLPGQIAEYEAWKRAALVGEAEAMPIPEGLPFQMIDGVATSPAVWKQIALSAGWQMTRMNLNTFKRHGVFDDPEITRIIAQRLCNAHEIERARVMPYQLFAAYKHATDVPQIITSALYDAMSIAITNVPRYDGRIVIACDVSSSMRAPITGARGVPSKISCVEAAALIACAIAAGNHDTEVCAFDAPGYSYTRGGAGAGNGLYILGRPFAETEGHVGASVLRYAARLAEFGGGGTDCSIPLANLNAGGAKADLVIYVSDNESWVDRGTGIAREWARYKVTNPNAKLVLIDLTPSTTTPMMSRKDVLNVGGFSDAAWKMISIFLESSDEDSFVSSIEALTPFD